MGWLTWAGIALKAIYVLSGLKALIEHWQAKREGAKEQQAKDVNSTLESVNKRVEVEASDSRLTTEQLRERLRRDSSGG